MYKSQLLTIAVFSLFSVSCTGSNQGDEDISTLAETAQATDATADQAEEQDVGTEATDEAEILSPLAGPCVATEDCAPIGPNGDVGTVCINNQLIGGLGLDVEADIPNGYCSNMTCNSADECGDGAVQCIDLKASGENIPFNVCVKGCTEGADECFGGQQCFCDPEQGIFNTEGSVDFCSCLPDVLIELISGG